MSSPNRLDTAAQALRDHVRQPDDGGLKTEQAILKTILKDAALQNRAPGRRGGKPWLAVTAVALLGIAAFWFIPQLESPPHGDPTKTPPRPQQDPTRTVKPNRSPSSAYRVKFVTNPSTESRSSPQVKTSALLSNPKASPPNPQNGRAPSAESGESLKQRVGRRVRRRVQRQADPDKTVASTIAPKVEPTLDEKQSKAGFRAAHRLHFSAPPQRALQAWDQFLSQNPSGIWVLEARYNRAVVLIRLGRFKTAETALVPFAAGHHGELRQTEARQLLSSVPD